MDGLPQRLTLRTHAQLLIQVQSRGSFFYSSHAESRRFADADQAALSSVQFKTRPLGGANGQVTAVFWVEYMFSFPYLFYFLNVFFFKTENNNIVSASFASRMLLLSCQKGFVRVIT